MTEKENEIITRLDAIIEPILSGSPLKATNLDNIESSGNPTVDEFAGKVLFLGKQYSDCYRFIMDLSQGKLDTEPPFRNSFANPYKQLHSELRYLTWQIQQISDGDYSQQVSFSGDFSHALNKMILSLREKKVLADLLEESNRTKDKLFSIIAHDLKNPFNALVGISDMLLKEADSGNLDVTKEFARLIYESASNGYALLINLLEWSRLQSGRIQVNPEELDLRTVILGNIKLVCLTALTKEITIEYDDPNDYPVVSDNAILNTIFRNLLSNAIKYTQPGGEIQVSVEKTSGFYLVSVKDSGIGIREEELKKLFRIDSIQSTRGTRNEEGTGLGLILCKDFIHKIGGEITVESVYGKGSTFTFSIPDTIK